MSERSYNITGGRPFKRFVLFCGKEEREENGGAYDIGCMDFSGEPYGPTVPFDFDELADAVKVGESMFERYPVAGWAQVLDLRTGDVHDIARPRAENLHHPPENPLQQKTDCM